MKYEMMVGYDRQWYKEGCEKKARDRVKRKLRILGCLILYNW